MLQERGCSDTRDPVRCRREGRLGGSKGGRRLEGCKGGKSGRLERLETQVLQGRGETQELQGKPDTWGMK